MKVRNIVREGAVVALSLGLASLGTGMGLTANDTSAIQSQPELLVGGPGGAGANYFSGPGTQGPDGLHLCTESAYDWGRYGPVSFCSVDVPLVKVIVTAAGYCLFGVRYSERIL